MVGARRGQALPEDVALPRARPSVGKDGVHREHPRAGRFGNERGVVGGTVVDDEQVVDEAGMWPGGSHGVLPNGLDDRADGRRLVTSGEADGNRSRSLELVEGERVEILGAPHAVGWHLGSLAKMQPTPNPPLRSDR